jgi:hypothetical protein
VNIVNKNHNWTMLFPYVNMLVNLRDFLIMIFMCAWGACQAMNLHHGGV